MAKFVHLHTHSHYSLLDGLAKIDDLVNEAVRQKMPALALTDHGNLYGAVEFYKKAKAAGIKPIIGVEAYLAARSLYEKQPGIDDKRYHLILLAENNEGYQNLLKLVSISNLEGFYYKPRLDKETIRKYSKGLICLSACLSGEISRALLANDSERAEEIVNEYQEIFGKDNFFLEIEHHPNIPNHAKIQKELVKLAEKMKTPIVAAQDVHYIKAEDAEAQDILLAVQTNNKIADEERLTMKGDDFSFRSEEEMEKFFHDVPEAIENTLKIANRCDVEIELNKIQLPHFDVPEGETPNSFLEKICKKGIEKRYGNNPSKEIQNRLKYELAVIEKAGFASYFLIVHDFVNWAKENKIVVGPGRGSAAGSLVSYALNITDIDPLKYNLIFERFLNPDRISMPDIDLDFADTRRDEVIEYLSRKYGTNHVAQIITFGTMAARAAVRDTGRALGLGYAFCDEMAKLIPLGFSLKKALEKVSELKNSYNTNPDAKKLFDTARKLEGVARHASVHACGIVITKNNLNESIPLQYATSKGEEGIKRQIIITQYEMHAIEDLGLLKMDLLGLKNLTVIESAVKFIKENQKKEINTENLEPNDPEVFKTLAEGHTVSVFQLEGGGMTHYLKELKPTNFEDIIAMISLYRPGPMELIPSYIKRKNGQEKISYLHPKLEPILKNTYGIMLYQEQLMQAARDIAGFTMPEADTLRKAIGKKIKKLMMEQKGKFIKGVEKNTGSKSLGEKLWELVEPFGAYGFNRSHAAAYAAIAYQTAYLKTYFPLEFMTAAMAAEEKDVEKIAILVSECERLKIKVLGPDINLSSQSFTPEPPNLIRFGLRAIKNVGHNIVEAIVNERTLAGPFRSLNDLLERIQDKDLNKKSLEALAKAGALDALAERNSIIQNMDEILEYHKESGRQSNKNQVSLFSMLENKSSLPGLKLKDTAPASSEEKLQWEKELLGLYISGHPLEKFEEALKKYKVKISDIKKLENGHSVVAAGMIEEIKKIITKKGEPMLFMKLADFTDSIETVIFPRMLLSFSHLFQIGNCLIIKGKLSFRNSNPSIIVDELKRL
ncbi:MAG: DNA polymerase III subunit alpha [Candidatus Tagabacteria bacterium]